VDERDRLRSLFELDEDDGDTFVPRVLPVRPPPTAARIPSRYRQSAGASMLAAGLLGLRDVIEPPKDDKPVVEQFADGQDRRRPIEVYLDPDDPAASVVVIRDPADSN
jgi:hypothetical protein